MLTANAPARRFYERLGGDVVAERSDGGDDELAYGWRNLTPLLGPARKGAA
ncbi:hypothetical protein SCH01S_42_01000 [Sphingomonas changbaiensis NBRC 104936]|uniref:Acetyltransferase n=1 Tax=Sphingomonas changbaiensis NBRC 104936 TaxID=1219043 RepID=A0A0E9MQL5_9SPHN|nr:hypothetical protein SCH01S_42_01000 [Sphingomonas changbaiensis NBRC 104936]